MSRRAHRVGTALAAAAASCGGGGGEPPRAGPEAGGAGAPAAAACTFEDVTRAAGIDFVHRTGGTGSKLLPETMGAGACLFDADGDGALDLFLVDSGALPAASTAGGGRSKLYRGRGDGTFREDPGAIQAPAERYGMGAAAADFDADGDRDLYVTALGEDALLVNDGERFREATAGAGLEDPGWRDASGERHPSWSTAAAWLDADADGDLDLFVGGYCRWTPEHEIFTTLDGVHKAFTTPDRYAGLAPRLYANRGDGSFERVADAALDGATGKALGVATWDLEGDGFPEILVANDTRPNFLFRREADGSWSERGEAAGIAYDENGRARAGMGIDVADLHGDGAAWVAIGNFAGEATSLYRWDGRRFRPRAAQDGVAYPTLAPLAFGLRFADLDLDGRLDLLIANGHIEPDITRFRPDERHAQPAQLLRGLDGGGFSAVPPTGGLGVPRVGRGLALGDVDGDGDLDVVLTQNGGPAVLLENRLQRTQPRRFLRVRLEGGTTNPDALGAVVTLRAGARTQRRRVHTGSSYLSQGELTLTFGLGALDQVDEVSVRWPGGRVERYPVPAVDRTLVLRAP